MILQETKLEIEVRAYTKAGTLLNTKWLKNCDLIKAKELFPEEAFNYEVKDWIWIETKEQADYLEVNFEDLSSVDYEVFMYNS